MKVHLGGRLAGRPPPVRSRGRALPKRRGACIEPLLSFRGSSGRKLRSVYGLKRSETKKATAIQTPINLPSRGHVAQEIEFFRRRGSEGQLRIAKAYRAEAYEHLPVHRSNEKAPVAKLTTPADGEL